MAQIGLNGLSQDDTICAPSTPSGRGGVSMVRVSGADALKSAVALCGKRLVGMRPNTFRLATIRDGEGVIDQGVVSYYAAPCSYTGQEVVEYAVHGSPYIVQRLLRALSVQGVRLAGPGEFTRRAFLNGRMDLSQAEAVADLIAGEGKAAHDIAMNQLRGGFSSEIEALRSRLLDFVSLVELELDFGEEDVEFADRNRLQGLLEEMDRKVRSLRTSFQAGNVLKEGVSVAIVGKPNAGKSTLINALLHEERALVSDIPGTTRDTIEETWLIDGVKFRFIDTAGLRQGKDEIERMGIERTLAKMRQAKVWLYLFDASKDTLAQAKEEAGRHMTDFPEDGRPQVLYVANKIDRTGTEPKREGEVLYVSAKDKAGMAYLEDALRAFIPQLPDADAVILTNARHYEVLGLVLDDLAAIRQGLADNLPGDLFSVHVRSAVDHLGLITGKIVADDVLRNVFSRFCIGK